MKLINNNRITFSYKIVSPLDRRLSKFDIWGDGDEDEEWEDVFFRIQYFIWEDMTE